MDDGWWTALQLDSAVIFFGSYIEGKLSEFDEHGKPKYELADFLDHKPKRMRLEDIARKMSSVAGLMDMVDHSGDNRA